jgi:hypothetical protein
MGALGNPMYGQNKYDASADGKIGEIVHVKPASDGTVASPTKTLTASDSGNVYIIDISANTAAFVLPEAATAKGSVFTFILGIESDAEASKDLIVASYAATEFIMGAGLAAGAVFDTTVADDEVSIDTSDGAAGGGDRLKVICDGVHYYILDFTCLTSGAINSGTATRS